MSIKIAYFDCAAGIAGDMCLGALVSLGVPITYFSEILARMKTEKSSIDKEVKLHAELVMRCGQEAVKLHVNLLDEHAHGEHRHNDHKHHKHRHLPEIIAMIQSAQLPPQVEKNSLQIFQQLAIAEGAVHGIPPEKVHFHEVGAIDAIVDIVCTCAGLEWLGIGQIFCSALPTGGGFVDCAHGKLPVPVPAVLQLWQMRNVPIFSNGIDQELVTPTGAAIVTTLSAEFGSVPAMKISKIGLGAGTKDLAIPNILRIWIGESTDLPASSGFSASSSFTATFDKKLEDKEELTAEKSDKKKLS